MVQLTSWNDSKSKHAILDFVERVTTPGSPDFVPKEARIAVYDNDGTLWCEKPMPIQADFLFRKIGKMAKENHSLLKRQPWKAVVEKDYAWLSGVITKHYNGDDSDLKSMAAGIFQAFEGTTIEDFETKTEAFFQTAQNPALKRSYLECAYQPMVELLQFLEANGFTNYIATGGGRDFMRPITQNLYGVPPERVIGSSVTLSYRDDGEVANLVHQPAKDLFDDGPEKPVRIWSRIGRRPILAVGNANGDIPMLHFCSHPSRPSLSLLIDHDDEKREFAYESGAQDAHAQADEHGWRIVSMKRDWKDIFATTLTEQIKTSNRVI